MQPIEICKLFSRNHLYSPVEGPCWITYWVETSFRKVACCGMGTILVDLRETIDLSVNETRVWVRTWLFCIVYIPCLECFWYMLGVDVEV